MQNNRIWEQVAGFMQQLRCENLSEKSMVHMPGQKEIQEKLEQAQIQGEGLLEQMPEKESGTIQEWLEQLENNASIEAQQAYCQGYVDCILLLNGMGLLRPELTGGGILEHIRQ